MPRVIRSKPKSFLEASRRDWQFEVFAWLLRTCGGYPKFMHTDLVLPTEEYFPDPALSGHAGVAALFRRVREHAGMTDWPCNVEPLTDAAAGPARLPLASAAGVPVITYVPGDMQPVSQVAWFARELARYLVETYDEAPPGGQASYEPALDLAAVFMGFGIFMSNAAFERARFDLNEGELAHALALFCHLRRLDAHAIEVHLNPHLRKYLRLAARDLAQYELQFQKLRSVFPVIPFDAAARAE